MSRGVVTSGVPRGVSREGVSEVQYGSKQHKGLVGGPGSRHEDLPCLTEAVDRVYDMKLKKPHPRTRGDSPTPKSESALFLLDQPT